MPEFKSREEYERWKAEKVKSNIGKLQEKQKGEIIEETKLINCPSCQSEISRNAQACPKCGEPLVVSLSRTGDRINKFSIPIFAIAFICFFLPFVNIHCGGQKIITLTGFQLATGKIPEPPKMFGEMKQLQEEQFQEMPKPKGQKQPLVIFAFISAMAGLGLSFLRGRKGLIASATAGIGGLIFLLLLKVKLDDDILKEGQGALQLEYGIGFWLTFLLFLSATGLNGFLFFRRKRDIS